MKIITNRTFEGEDEAVTLAHAIEHARLLITQTLREQHLQRHTIELVLDVLTNAIKTVTENKDGDRNANN